MMPYRTFIKESTDLAEDGRTIFQIEFTKGWIFKKKIVARRLLRESWYDKNEPLSNKDCRWITQNEFQRDAQEYKKETLDRLWHNV